MYDYMLHKFRRQVRQSFGATGNVTMRTLDLSLVKVK